MNCTSCFVVIRVLIGIYAYTKSSFMYTLYNDNMIEFIGLSGSTKQAITLYHTNNYEWYQDDFLKCLFG